MIRFPPPRKYFRHNGSAILAVVVVCGIFSSMMGLASAKVSQTTMNTLGSSKVASQAQHYANSKAELIEGMRYTELASQAKTNIAGSSFYEEVIVGNETAMPSNQNIKEKPCRVNVYYGDESIPRATLSFNRYSVSQNESSIPKGTILPWYGKSSDIPEGFALCDDTKGTPDLRNRFLVGAGSNYALGDTGGEDQVTLTGTQIGNHYHYYTRYGYPVGFYKSRRHGAFSFINYPAPFPAGNILAMYLGGDNSDTSDGTAEYGSNFKAIVQGSQNSSIQPSPFITSLAVGTAAQEAHENRPPYYALYYIMKLE